ncbi:uncharacterized protein B0I36DRAFT_311414 [Microdochium trichocladiopsis]|uniref:Uncharacterized protein n=1 Tax=Microdochium trichocladiopsis TaxID=1682393 RepID=A0A9P8YIS6_9PEZI|nr:uncharacterized protein B0I36DRAFT_311414 [Microdochium trichocladiopsis]KAH7040762.1 hypothetical protein B0I36DRAFT_311414 [Microdochium trichocladiopsis]
MSLWCVCCMKSTSGCDMDWFEVDDVQYYQVLGAPGRTYPTVRPQQLISSAAERHGTPGTYMGNPSLLAMRPEEIG